ncbi:MAG: N-6 DNA methylase [Anaerolineae bacterium]|nr:N-6 DNA methylase [Anaerolineae bacterium]
MNKLTGSYYTPKELSLFVWEHVIKRFKDNSSLCILEPSCGDGIFLQVASEYQTNKGLFLDAIEIDSTALEKAKKTLSSRNGHFNANFIEDDFLKIELPTKYDLIIGNPPYIGRNLLSEQQKELCQQIHIEGGVDSKSIRNIWTAFLIKATSLLKSTGVLAFILLGEILQVNYAEKLQSFLEKKFKFIEILTFHELIFPALRQDVVVIFAYKEARFSGISYKRVHNINSLDKPIEFPKRISTIANQRIKWSNFFLTDNELDFLTNTAQKVKKVSHYCTSTPGIVTAANKFFIVSKETLNKYNLEPFCEPILQKAEFVDKVVSINEALFEELKKANKPCFLINLGDKKNETLPSLVQNYLQEGIDQDIHKRYKTSQRKPWYNIPSVWIPEGVIFKRCHKFPKLLKNEAQVLFTDSAYRIRPRGEFDINSFIYSFYNSLTLVFCEINGRYYGDGVLELTPQEFRNLPIPYKSISGEQFHTFNKAFAKSKSIEQILQQNDAQLLTDLGIDAPSLRRLEQIRQKLLVRRLKINPDERDI